MSVEGEKDLSPGFGIVQRIIESQNGEDEPPDPYYLIPGEGVFFGRDGSVRTQSSSTPMTEKDISNLLYFFFLDSIKGQLHIMEGVRGRIKHVVSKTEEPLKTGELSKGGNKFVYAWDTNQGQAKLKFLVQRGRHSAHLN